MSLGSDLISVSLGRVCISLYHLVGVIGGEGMELVWVSIRAVARRTLDVRIAHDHLKASPTLMKGEFT